MSVAKPGDLVFTGQDVKGWDVAARTGVDVPAHLPAVVVSVDPPNMMVLLDGRQILLNVYSFDLLFPADGT